MDRFESGGELWRKLCADGMVKPTNYDKEFEDDLKLALGLPNNRSVQAGLDATDISAEMLTRVMLRQLKPYALMLKDLLRLYARIGAAAGTNENLKIRYEFQPGNPLDILLKNFREISEKVIRGVENVLVIRTTSDYLWSSPCIGFKSGQSAPDFVQAWLAEYQSAELLPAVIPPLPSVGASDIDSTVVEILDVMRAVLDRAHNISDRLDVLRGAVDLPEQAFGIGDPLARDLELILELFRNDWLAVTYEGLARQVAQAVGDPELARNFSNQWKDWLSGLQRDQAELKTERRVLEDLLSLPTWGQRHEVYSAWLVAEMDTALDRRLVFRVPGGVLAFPFRPTVVATLACADGKVELWAELRSDYLNPIGKSRTGAIQPDYRFKFAAADRIKGTNLAVEAKQYLRAKGKVHGETLADYTGGLPNAVVILANYGPVSKSAMTFVPKVRRDRAVVVERFMPTSPAATKIFREAVAAALPPPPAALALIGDLLAISVVWDPRVQDVDLHAYLDLQGERVHLDYQERSAGGARLLADRFEGGPESLIFGRLSSGNWNDADIWVNVFSGESLSAANPRLIVQTVDDVARIDLPEVSSGDPSVGTAWNPMTLTADSVIIHPGRFGPLPE